MRNALALMLASVVAALLISSVWFWTSSPRVELTVANTVGAASAGRAAPSARPVFAREDVEVTGAIPDRPLSPPAPDSACARPDALGVSRVVAVDTTGGPAFGFQHFKQLDFLADREVVLTFDDGPWPGHTPAVLKALADECTKAVFFPIGKHATYHPEILRQVAAAGHTVGAHTWSHANLNSKKMTDQLARDEIEKGYSAVKLALGAAPAPFFRFPELQHGPSAMAYLGTRNIAIFSTDMDTFDFKLRKPEQVRQSVMEKLKKHGKGIVLLHDFQNATAEATMDLLNDLKAGGYKIVFMKPKSSVTTIASYDEAILKQLKGPMPDTRPTSSVVRTIGE